MKWIVPKYFCKKHRVNYLFLIYGGGLGAVRAYFAASGNVGFMPSSCIMKP